MAAMLAFLVSVAVMLLMTPIGVHTKCVQITYSYDRRDVKCSDMSIDLVADYVNNQNVYNAYTYIGRLYLHGVSFTSLRTYSLHLPMMSYLEVTHSNGNMNENIINNLKNLNIFNVSYSGTSVHHIFKGFYSTASNSKLEIKFDNNNINQITSICLGSYNVYWSLSLNNNKIITFTKDNIGSETCKYNLKKLDLKYNNLLSFDANVFAEMPGLEWIDLSFNKITTFHNNIRHYHGLAIALKELYLDKNNILEIKENNFKFLYALEVLSLALNNLNYIDSKAFNDLNKLKLLDLSNNELTSLDPRVFSGLKASTKLFINGNLNSKCVKQIEQTYKTKINETISQVKANYSDEMSQLRKNYSALFSKFIEDISELKQNNSEIIKLLKHNNSEQTSQLRGNYNNQSNQLKQNYNEHISISTNIGITVISIMLIVMVVVPTCIGVILVRMYRSKLASMITGEVKSAENREMTTMQEEELQYDYVEVTRPNQSQEDASCIYEVPSELPTHHVSRDSVCSDNSLYGVNLGPCRNPADNLSPEASSSSTQLVHPITFQNLMRKTANQL